MNFPSELITGIEDTLPAEAFLAEENRFSPELPDTYYFGHSLDYVAEGGYRLTRANGYPILTVNGKAVAAHDTAIELANELGPWRAIPRYYHFHTEERERYADRKTVEWYDKLEQILTFAAWCRENPAEAENELRIWNLRHPEHRMDSEAVTRAENLASDRLFGTDLVPDGETVSWRRSPAIV